MSLAIVPKHFVNKALSVFQIEEFLPNFLVIQQLTDMKPNFDDEQISMSGKTLREILQKTARFGIDNYLNLQNDCHQK